MVAPNKVADLYTMLDAADMVYDTYVENVQTLIDQESPATRDREDAATGFGWTRYHKLEEIYEWLESLVSKYPGKVRAKSGERSFYYYFGLVYMRWIEGEYGIRAGFWGVQGVQLPRGATAW